MPWRAPQQEFSGGLREKGLRTKPQGCQRVFLVCQDVRGDGPPTAAGSVQEVLQLQLEGEEARNEVQKLSTVAFVQTLQSGSRSQVAGVWHSARMHADSERRAVRTAPSLLLLLLLLSPDPDALHLPVAAPHATQKWTSWNVKEKSTSIRIRVSKVQPGPEQGPALVMEAAEYSPGDSVETPGLSVPVIRSHSTLIIKCPEILPR